MDLRLDDEDEHLQDLVAEQEEEQDGSLVVDTSSLGLKQSAVRWLESEGCSLAGLAEASGGDAVAVAGSWDETVNGGEDQIALWSVSFSAPDAMEDEQGPESTQLLCAAPHAGCVLGLSVGGSGGGDAAALVFTASGTGGAACYAVGEGASSVGLRWAEKGEVHRGAPALAVEWSAAARRVALVGEDGQLALLEPETGRREPTARQSNEPILDGARRPPAEPTPLRRLPGAPHSLLFPRARCVRTPLA